jgi:hypothetical protein
MVSYAAPPQPALRFILAHLQHASSCLDLSRDGPPDDKCARQRGIREIDRQGIIEHPRVPEGVMAHPPVRTAILVDPGGRLRLIMTRP